MTIRKHFLAFASALALLTGSAFAGDFATLQPLGFSDDGKVFAFEQYGVQDGSGFPYAEIFFLDLEKDRFVAPSPIRIRIDDESQSEAAARDRARLEAKPLFERYRPEEHRGRIVVDNPETELSADPNRVRFTPRPIEPTPDHPVELRLERIAIASNESCPAMSEAKGYRLIRIGLEPDQRTTLIHEDSSLPKSRGCAQDYKLSQILVFDKPDGGFKAVAIIGVKSVGFEGPDLRYVANPIPMD